PEKEKLSEEIISIIGKENTKLIGIAPFAQYESKMYPLDMMEEVIEKLTENNDYKILLFGGGKKETELLQSIEDKFKNTVSLAGKIKLKQELAVISHMECMVSMDSANAHLAAMQGVKTITIWGVTHPFTGFYPFHQQMENALIPDLKKYPNIPCSIYGNKVCEGYEDVMRTISSKDVVAKIEEVI
ncbi:MAG: glycosyltransferase family 9 protein, partial [Bacteroidota bacterium]